MKKPGEISEELKEALSIPPLAPPPWLIAMQRYGPPPSYPNLRIPGLNSPIPAGFVIHCHASAQYLLIPVVAS
jgi:splicing factor 3B subunit 2